MKAEELREAQLSDRASHFGCHVVEQLHRWPRDEAKREASRQLLQTVLVRALLRSQLLVVAALPYEVTWKRMRNVRGVATCSPRAKLHNT